MTGTSPIISSCSLMMILLLLTAACHGAAAAAVGIDTTELPVLAFEEGYTRVFGDTNLMLHRDGKAVHILLDQRTGAGFASQDLYLHGFFSASIKLPSSYAAGVVVAFYMSNADVFESNHDELDFEFLGNARGREWRVQTNVYANGSTAQGREERYGLPFDPTADYHSYAILWTADRIVFSIDSIPIREIVRSPPSMAAATAFPAKPMSLYATIWDGSSWATAGGRYRVNYKHAPFVAQFTDLVLHGCAVDPTDHSSTCDVADGAGRWRFDGFELSPEQKASMARFREDHMTYSYCYDRRRYPTPLRECDVDPKEAKRLRGMTRFRGRHSHRLRRKQQQQQGRNRSGAGGEVEVHRGMSKVDEA